MARRTTLPPLLILGFLLACSEPAPREVCGESFCLPEGAKLLSREAPVEDFNLYRVEAEGQLFVIYEGNAPNTSEALPKAMRVS